MVQTYKARAQNQKYEYLTIIPRAHEGEGNNRFSKIQLVVQKYPDKTTLASKMRFSSHYFSFQSRHFLLLVGYNI